MQNQSKIFCTKLFTSVYYAVPTSNEHNVLTEFQPKSSLETPNRHSGKKIIEILNFHDFCSKGSAQRNDQSPHSSLPTFVAPGDPFGKLY